MPKGFLTEDGPRPEFAEPYGALELPTSSYPERTRRDARDAGATAWFGTLGSPGGRTTHDAARALGRPIFDVVEGTKPSDVVAWLRSHGFPSLNVAGNRESSNPGIGERAERFLTAVFRKLVEGKGPCPASKPRRVSCNLSSACLATIGGTQPLVSGPPGTRLTNAPTQIR